MNLSSGTERFLSSFVVLLLLMSGSLIAQLVTGTITGTVVDPEGLAIPGTTVTLQNERTGEARNTLTDDVGSFVLIGVPQGTYTLRVEIPGFRAYERRNVVLSAGERLALGSIQLSLGELSDTVTVTSEGAAVQSESGAASALLTPDQLDSMALRSRDLVAYLRLLPGVPYTQDIEAPGGLYGTPTMSIQGMPAGGNVLYVDGMQGMDLGTDSVFSATVPVDAVAEVNVVTSGFRAEHGSRGGAVIDVVSKAGSRDFSGSLYWYKRHEKLNANHFFRNEADLPRPIHRYATVGGTFGGPIPLPGNYNRNRDKLFFFYTHERWLIRVPKAIQRHNMPTALERQGDFSQSLDTNGELIVIRDPLTGEPFPGNVIPPDRIHPFGPRLLSVLPEPNFFDRSISGGAYNYIFQDSGDNPKRYHSLRVDWRPTERDSFSWRGNRVSNDNRGYTGVAVGMPNWGLMYHHYNHIDEGMSLTYNRTFSPSVINELSLSTRRSWELGDILPEAEEEFRQLQRHNIGLDGLGNLFNINAYNMIPQMTFGGIAGAPSVTWDGRFPIRGWDNVSTIADNISWIRNTHVFKFGIYAALYDNVEAGELGYSNYSGRFDFSRDVNNPLGTGHPYANALLGHFRQYTESSSTPRSDKRQWLFEWYAQDSWKATPHLTLDYGVRWMWHRPYVSKDGNGAVFAGERYDPAKAPLFFQPGFDDQGNRVGVNPLTGEFVPAIQIGTFVPGTGDPNNGMVTTNDPNYPDSFRDPQGISWMPRLGFAYDVGGRGKTAIRGGVGINRFGREGGGPTWLLMWNQPIQYNPVIHYGTFDTYLETEGLLAPADTTRTVERAAKRQTVYNWNLVVQHDIGLGTVVDVGYVGNKGHHLNRTRNINLVPYGARFLEENLDFTTGRALPDNFFRPYPGFGTISHQEHSGTSNYHGLQIGVNRRYARNLQFGMSYTWSKTMEKGTSVHVPVEIWEVGPAAEDQTHRLIVNYTWDLPQVSNHWNSAVVRHLLDNWRLSGITAFVSGFPAGIGFSTTDGADIAGGGDGVRPVITGPLELSRSERSPDRWFNTDAVERPAQGTYGNAAWRPLRLPGRANWDLTLVKDVPVGETAKVQIRWEFYNLFNTAQWSSINTTARFDPDGNQVNTLFGQAVDTHPPRIMQASLRLAF